MVTLFAVCTIAPSSAAGVKPPIPDIDADDIGAATIVLATCNRLYRLALPTSNRPSHRRCNHQISINALADSVATAAIITTTPLLAPPALTDKLTEVWSMITAAVNGDVRIDSFFYLIHFSQVRLTLLLIIFRKRQ